MQGDCLKNLRVILFKSPKKELHLIYLSHLIKLEFYNLLYFSYSTDRASRRMT